MLRVLSQSSRKKTRITFVAIGGLVALWLLFPPRLHRQLHAIRSMQAVEDDYLDSFLKSKDSREPKTPNARASFEEWKAYTDKMMKGPLANMPLRFDVNRYFSAFDRIKMDSGWLLDYVYCSTRNHAYPILYARPRGSARLTSSDAFESTFGKSTNLYSAVGAYLGHVRTDGSPESFRQLAALLLVGDQFCLYWHANYNDTRIMSRFPVYVSSTRDNVTVKMLVFSKWAGLSLFTVRMKRSFPHQLLEYSNKVIIPFDCDILF